MEQRLAKTWRMTVNEKNFIKTALLAHIRVDNRSPFDYRDLTINFGSKDGSSEVQLGDTRVLGFVTGQLVQPYRDRPNEGTLSIFTEFSPMADPSFEPGRPGEFAIELGRIVDRGLRESRAVDTESLCVLAGKLVWSIRIDLHILDNGGNLLDASNIAALAALMTFRRSDCTLGRDEGQEVIVHPPEVREPLPLIVHHLPISVTFAFFDNENLVVVDPTHYEEAIMEGRLTATLNTNEDICAIQKGGGLGVSQSVIMQCLRIASVKAAEITSKIRNAVESFDSKRASRKVKRHSSSGALDVGELDMNLKGMNQFDAHNELSRQCLETLRLNTEDGCLGPSKDTMDKEGLKKVGKSTFHGVACSWDPYSKGIDAESLKSTLAASRATTTCTTAPGKKKTKAKDVEATSGTKPPATKNIPISSLSARQTLEPSNNGEKTLKDAVKPKHKRKQKQKI